jgi:phosphatidylserine/phosphatidylglycerophosphate/cardiolipin synthase-like enzyme
MKKLYIILVTIAIIGISCIYVPKVSSAIADNTTKQAECYFTRSMGIPDVRLVMKYGEAKEKLDIAIYSLTEPSIVLAIGDAYRRGVQVRVITDKVQASGNSQKHAINDLLLVGVPVKQDIHSGIMHLKMSLIDNQCVTVGSYNYTRNASTDNDEILCFIYDPNIIKQCQSEFDRMWISTQYEYITELK